MLKCQTCGQWMGHIQCLQGRPKECSVCASVPAETNNHSPIQPNNHSPTVNCPAPTSLTLKVKMRTPHILLHRLTRQDLARATRRQSRRLISKALKNEAKASTSVPVHPTPMDRRQSRRLNPTALKNEAKASTSVHVHPPPMDHHQAMDLGPVLSHPPPMDHHQAMDLGPVLPHPPPMGHHQAMDLGPVLSHPLPMDHHQAMDLGPVLPHPPPMGHHQAMNVGPVLSHPPPMGHHQAMDLGPVLSHPPRVDAVPGPYIVKVPLHMMYYPHLMSGSMVCNSVSSWSGGQCQWIVKQDTHNEFRFCFSRIYS